MDSSTASNAVGLAPSQSRERPIHATSEKAVNGTADKIAPLSTTNIEEYEPETKYLGPWKLFPIAIALALAIFILGLASIW